MKTYAEKIRRVTLAPYGRKGPTFTLTLWDTGRRDGRGQSYLAYRLTSHGRPIFEGEDFSGSPMHTDDSDATVRSLLTFLTLRPGDTDADYFSEYTPQQIAFRDEHAEYLAWEVTQRFGED